MASPDPRAAVPRPRRAARWGAALGLALGLALAAALSPAPGGAEEEGTRDTMQVILAHLELLVATVVEERATGPVEVWESLHVISEQAALLAGHQGEADPLAGFLGASLERMSSVVARTHELYEDERWRDLLLRMTDVCVACHTRGPASDSAAAEAFVAREAVRRLPRGLRANLETALRRFRAAAESWEALVRERLAEAHARGVEPELAEPLTGLLVLTERVGVDRGRVRALLAAVSGHPALTSGLRASVAGWRDALGAERGEASPAALVAQARALDATSPHGGLVHWVRASALLYQTLRDASVPAPERARAYHLLGLIEHRLNQGHWLPRTAFLLEAAIRADPGSAVAREAFAELDRIVRAMFAGERLPGEVSEHLRMLAELSGAAS